MSAAAMDRFNVPPSARVPACRTLVARGNAITKRTGLLPRPAAFPPSVEAGLRACGIGAYRLPGSSRSQWQGLESDAEAPGSGCWLIRPRHLPLRGQQRHWPMSAAPLSRFTPARGTRRDTSNERVDCTTQVAGFYLAAASGIYIENESLHLDLTGFLKL